MPCNVVSTVMEGITKCESSPFVPASLLQYLGKSYNCWYPALMQLEQRVEYVKNDNASLDGTIFEFISYFM